MNVRDDVRVVMRPRSMGLVLVVAAHGALAWLLVNGLGLRIALPTVAEPLQARMIDDPEARVAPPPPPAAPAVPRRQEVTPPPPDIPTIVEEAPTAPSVPTATGGSDTVPGGEAIAAPRREAVSVDARHPLTQPPYPAASVRFGEEGTVTLELRVGRDGRVLDARVLRSSGYPRLDAAAIAESRHTWRLRPAREDGRAVEASYTVRVSFRLDRR
ncbi:MAG: energy transducer TonB [Steroidobacteraceae bacterium]|jgi:protein TonB|nr:energy transducer TonB [Steroidobacteraceae bacterium]